MSLPIGCTPKFRIGERVFVVDQPSSAVYAATVKKRVIKFVEEPAGDVGKFVTYQVRTEDGRVMDRGEDKVYGDFQKAGVALCERMNGAAGEMHIGGPRIFALDIDTSNGTLRGKIAFPKSQYPTKESAEEIVRKCGIIETLPRAISPGRVIGYAGQPAFPSGNELIRPQLVASEERPYLFTAGVRPAMLAATPGDTVIEWVDQRGDGGQSQLQHMHWSFVRGWRVLRADKDLVPTVRSAVPVGGRTLADTAATERARTIEATLNGKFLGDGGY